MGVIRAGLAYFGLVFTAGFVLALVRIPVLVPRFGVRTAELMETPVMLAVILLASHWLARRYAQLGRGRRLAAGLVALGLLLGAELAVAWLQGARSLAQIIAERDPVSGSVYLASLVVFALAPALWRPAPR